MSNGSNTTIPSVSNLDELPRKVSDKDYRRISKKIDKQLKKDKEVYELQMQEPRILILGSSDSGKSTLLKQLRILHGDSFTPEEIEQFRLSMYQNILSSSCSIVEFCTEQDVWPSEDEQIVSFECRKNTYVY